MKLSDNIIYDQTHFVDTNPFEFNDNNRSIPSAHQTSISGISWRKPIPVIAQNMHMSFSSIDLKMSLSNKQYVSNVVCT